MKKIIFSICIMILSLSASTAFASGPDTRSSSDIPLPVKKENKLSDEEISRLTKRVEEIKNMDKSTMTVKERRETRKELKAIKENVKRNGTIIYISGGTILIIILILLLI
jgi:hypothetical protein